MQKGKDHSIQSISAHLMVLACIAVSGIVSFVYCVLMM